MKIVNETPLVLALIPGPGVDGTLGATLIVKGTFRMVAGAAAPLADEQLPLCYGDAFHDDKKPGSLRFESDLAPFKPRADVVLVGSAHAPAGTQAKALDVTLQVGRLAKTLRVTGDRRWRCGGRFTPARLGEPEPFASLPLVYERAYGGLDTVGAGYCDRNPVGRGYFRKKRKKSINGALAPNIEDPRRPIRRWKDRPTPQGFGFYGRGWTPRLQYLGTHDEKWIEERSPLPPEDFRADFHNGAHPDLQVPGYLQGDEAVTLKRLTPDGELSFTLPGWRLGGQVTRLPGKGEAQALDLKLDTLVLLPGEGRLVLVWREHLPTPGEERVDAVIDTLTLRRESAPAQG